MEQFNLDQFISNAVKEPSTTTIDNYNHYGAGALSDSEILGLIIGRGSKKLNATSTAKAMINHFGGLDKLINMDWQMLTKIPGIGKKQAIRIKSAFELSSRLQHLSGSEKIQITCPQDAVAYFGPKLRDLTKEVFMVAFLNNAKVLKGYKKISHGGSTATIVDPSEVMRQAVMNEANSILLLHNHPSGNKKESRADIQLTKRLIEAGKLLGIPVNDHIIIAGNGYTSLRSKGLIK